MDRFIVYDTEDCPRRKELTAGAAQGSILGFNIWNASYDGILRMEMPDSCFLIGYADDVVALITARDVEAAQLRLGQVMCRVFRWMPDHARAPRTGVRPGADIALQHHWPYAPGRGILDDRRWFRPGRRAEEKAGHTGRGQPIEDQKPEGEAEDANRWPPP